MKTLIMLGGMWFLYNQLTSLRSAWGTAHDPTTCPDCLQAHAEAVARGEVSLPAISAQIASSIPEMDWLPLTYQDNKFF